MKIVCNNCQTTNNWENNFCISCGGALKDESYLVECLLEKQEELEKRYLNEINLLKKEIYLLRESVNSPVNKTESIIDDTVVEKTKINSSKDESELILNDTTDSLLKNDTQNNEVLNTTINNFNEKSSHKNTNTDATDKTIEQIEICSSKSSTIVDDETIPKEQLVTIDPRTCTTSKNIKEDNTINLVDSNKVDKSPKGTDDNKTNTIITKLLKPLHDGVEFLLNTYNKYKREDNLPIFFMTLAGIVAILYGFGYLMQNTLKNLGEYENIVKIAIGFFSSISVIVIGIQLSIKNSIYRDYASALMSLGIVLNYMLIYFLADLSQFPSISSAFSGFILIVLNTLIAILLSLKFETKIVSVIFLIGGALTPFYLNSDNDGTFYYLYLWLLTAGANIVAYKINWRTLSHLSFIVSTALIETLIFNSTPTSTLFVVYYHMFAYLFFYISIFSGIKIKKQIDKTDIVIITGTLGFFLYNLYSINEASLTTLGFTYIMNALVFITILLRIWKTSSKEIKMSIVSVVSTFIALAIPALFHSSIIGLFWSIEGLMLITLGFIHSISIIRKEGYIILFVALLKTLYISIPIYDFTVISLWNDAYLNFSIIGIILSILWFISYKFFSLMTSLEMFIYKTVKEIIPIWLSIIILYTNYYLFGLWALNIAPLLAIGLMLWTKQNQTKTTYGIGVSYIFILLVPYILSSIDTESLHFRDQNICAKFSIVELIISLWGLKLFHSIIFKLDTKIIKYTHNLRIAFFILIPIIFIGTVKRNAFEYIEPSLWISSLITFIFLKRLKYKILKIEFILFFLISLFTCFISVDIVGINIGILVMIIILVLEKVHDQKKLSKAIFRHLLMAIPYIVFASIAFSYGIAKDDLASALALFSTLSFCSVFFKNRVAVFNKNSTIGILLASISNLLSISILFIEHNTVGLCLTFINIIAYGIILNNNLNWYNKDKNISRWNTGIVLLQISIIVFYLYTLDFLDLKISGPVLSILLSIHAIALIFLSLKNSVKVYKNLSVILFTSVLLKVIFHDTVDFTLTQKIVMFICIGVLLLTSAYSYTKLKKRYS